MEAVPYEIREADIDEVLAAHGRDRALSDEERNAARDHVMRQVNDINDIVRSAAEQPARDARPDARRAHEIGDRPGETSPARRDAALAAIENVLIRDGFIEPDGDRVF